jgi:hypothetical protein
MRGLLGESLASKGKGPGPDGEATGEARDLLAGHSKRAGHGRNRRALDAAANL